MHTALEKIQSELETVRGGGSSEILETLSVFKWLDLFGPFTADPADLERPPSSVPVELKS